MKFFIDTADLQQIKEVNNWFPIDGVTTNPSLVAKSGKDHKTLISAIAQVVKGPVSAEVLSTKALDMVEEGKSLHQIHPEVVVKLPLTQDGLIATRKLSAENIPTNLTLCFSALQALSVAKAGATYVSIFVGRLDDIGMDGMEVVAQVLGIFSQYPEIKTKVLVASVRHTAHVLQSATLGADIVTMPQKLFYQMVHHPLTDKGLAQFLKDAGKIK